MNYQDIVSAIRCHEDILARWTGGWPGHNGAANSKYPNLAAELNAREFELSEFSETARVSREVMAGVIEGGEALTFEEMLRIAYHIGRSDSYLFSPVLSLVNANTRKGKIRTRKLESLIEQAEGYELRMGQTGRNARKTLLRLKKGLPVTYASYDYAVKMLEHKISEHFTLKVTKQTERVRHFVDNICSMMDSE